MTEPLDLEPIKALVAEMDEPYWGGSEALRQEIVAHVPSLIAEVERLREARKDSADEYADMLREMDDAK